MAARTACSLLPVVLLAAVAAGPARAAPPPNDNFAAATALSLGTPASSTNAESTGEVGEPNHAGVSRQANCLGPCMATVWYTLTVPAGKFVDITTCDASTNFDTVLAVYTGTDVGGLTQVVANDDDPLCGVDSRVDFFATAGTTYRVAVAGFASDDGTPPATGSFKLSATEDKTPPQTVLAASPSISTTGAISFSFSAIQSGTHAGKPATFQCALDGSAFAACTSPKGYARLGNGTHTFRVRAVDAAGNVDPTPQTRVFTVARPKARPLPAPRPAPPPATFSLGRARSLRNGTATLAVRVTGAGAMAAKDAGGRAPTGRRRPAFVRPVRKSVPGPGTETLTFRPTAAAAAVLRKKKSLRVLIDVSLNPGSGPTTTQTAVITLKRRPGRR